MKKGLNRSGREERCVGKDGMTLVEVMVALGVLVIVLAGAYQLVTQSARLTSSARNRYLATTIARSRIERAETFEYDDLHLLAEDDMFVNEFGTPDPFGQFRRSTIVDTNFQPFITSMEVVVDIKDMTTGSFEGQQESVSILFTKYIESGGP